MRAVHVGRVRLCRMGGAGQLMSWDMIGMRNAGALMTGAWGRSEGVEPSKGS